MMDQYRISLDPVWCLVLDPSVGDRGPNIAKPVDYNQLPHKLWDPSTLTILRPAPRLGAAVGERLHVREGRPVPLDLAIDGGFRLLRMDK